MGSTESKGVFLMIWGKPEYGYMAFNLAMSINKFCPDLSVHLLTDETAISNLSNLRYFSSIDYMDTPDDPAMAKITMYEKLPFDHNLFLDVDGLCIGNIEEKLDNLIADNKPFRCHVHARYAVDSPDDLPMMVWAKRSVIWDHYGFDKEVLPATQSSLLYIKKGEFSKSLYLKMLSNYMNKIPLDKLSNKWGGGQPDELYLNVTLAQLNYDPSCENIIWFADDHSKSIATINTTHTILSLFGTKNNVRPVFEKFYDSQLSDVSKLHGHRLFYKWKTIKNSKHANITKPVMIHPRAAAKGKFIRKTPFIYKELPGKTYLFTSYYDCRDRDRQNEIKTCLFNNINLKDIDVIYLFVDQQYDINSSKIIQVINKRPSYQDFFDYANKILTDQDYSIIANSDIYFDKSINWIKQINMNDSMIALSRYDIVHDGEKLAHHEYSQDVWIFKGNIKLTGIDYSLGLPRCDNRIAYDAAKQGYKVFNPAVDIITRHLHQVNVRNYTQKDALPGEIAPVYISSIENMQSNILVIIQPGKVGDLICILPICEFYHKKGYQVLVYCPVMYHSLFEYVDYCAPVTRIPEKHSKLIDLSFGLNTKSDVHKTWIDSQGRLESFVQLKYEIAGVDYSTCRNLNFNRNKQAESELFNLLIGDDPTPYTLLHRISDNGSPIEYLPGRVIEFAPVLNYTIFDWCKIIENATEIHCIDSSLCNLVDALPGVNAELHYYKTDKVRNKWDETVRKKNWIIHPHNYTIKTKQNEIHH